MGIKILDFIYLPIIYMMNKKQTSILTVFLTFVKRHLHKLEARIIILTLCKKNAQENAHSTPKSDHCLNNKAHSY